MGKSVTISIDPTVRQHAISAASRLKALWPDIAVQLTEETIILASNRRCSSELALTWICALLNEQLTVAGADARAHLLADLTA